MRELHIIMPMAGRGSRFANAGFPTPKPLIEVDGMPMFLKALSSIDGLNAAKKYTIVVRGEHVDKYALDALLKDSLPPANIVITREEPMGAAVDALRATKFLKSNEAVIVMDCDLWFKSQSYNNMVQRSLDGGSDIAGGVLTFEATDSRYSFAKIDKNNIVTRTAEKEAISNHAITGAYFFANSEGFVNSAHELLRRPISDKVPEYYMSLLYNILIDEGKKIQAAYVDEFASFGTPEELREYKSKKN